MFHTLSQLARALDRKKVSSVEVTQYFLNRINQLDTKLNSFINVLPEFALEQAKRADEKRAKGMGHFLSGIPAGLKDMFCVANHQTTCGSKMLSNFVPPYNAQVVAKLEEVGIVFLGKCNMDEFSIGSSSETSFYGPVKNPWDLERVPGGSSGGSSAAVAAGLSIFATGSDTGGSIRQPASFCNLVGLKPTYGRVSRYGMIAFASSFDQPGILTRTAEDAAHILNVIAGVDEKDSTSVDEVVPDYTATLNAPLKGLKIGIPEEYFEDGLNPQVEKCIQEAIKVYEKLGAVVKKVNLKKTQQGITLYYLISSAECASNLARYDGVRYGYRCEAPKNLEDLYTRSRSEGFGSEVKRRILIGTEVLSAEAYHAYYVKAQKVRTLLIQEFEQVFQEVDVLLGPVSPDVAFKLGEKINDPIHMYLSDIYTVTTSLAGLPAVSVPAGFVNDLPVGMQLIGPTFSEARLLNAAHAYQSMTTWHHKMPEGFEHE